ncbi:AraC family transcriptional regulator [Paucibacter sp. O1-1]|nr:AraC family transcriptional regulator [Paucibacter sp. O1-1]MDA3826842.1 AraC family transcriptional regulator [Paucibacter sp. O1-1]
MTAPDTSRRQYARRMNRVLDHIDAHLDSPLDLEALAALAHFSPFHFHRLFAAWMGETLGAYLQRRRLEAAAQGLTLMPEASVLQVALRVGFGSGEAFARAFKLHFGCTPTAWRAGSTERWGRYLQAQREQLAQLRKLDQDGRSVGSEDGDSCNFIESHSMQVEIKTLAPQRIAYLRYIGAYGPAVTQFWGEKVAPWMQAEGLLGRPSYGISHDDPSVTPADRCRYDAAVAVPPDYQASGEASITELPGGRYAVARFEGSGAEIGAAWSALFREWLPSSGLRCDGRPCFEHYADENSYDPATGRFSCEICIPVVKL